MRPHVPALIAAVVINVGVLARILQQAAGLLTVRADAMRHVRDEKPTPELGLSLSGFYQEE